MWRVFGDLLRTRGPAGAVVVLLPGLLAFGLLLTPFWLPGAEWAAQHPWPVLSTGAGFGAIGVRGWLLERRRQRVERERNPIHRWPPLPRNELAFIRSKLQKR